jgi:hypothetical protein
VADRDLDPIESVGRGDRSGSAVQDHDGRARGVSKDLDVAPPEVAYEAGAEHLDDCLLGGEAAGEELEPARVAVAVRPGKLSGGEHDPAVTLVPRDARQRPDVGDVDADSHTALATAPRRRTRRSPTGRTIGTPTIATVASVPYSANGLS